MSTPKNYDQVIAGIRARQKSASGDREAVHGIKDPNEQGTMTPPDHPDGDSDKKKNMPPSTENASHEGEALTDKDTNPSSTGSHVPGPVTDGNTKEDAATSPTVPLSKIATQVQGVMAGIAALRNKSAAASAPAATPAAKAAAKAASNDSVASDIEFTPEFHIKLASLIMETEEGVKFAADILRKAAGAEKAQELISSALEQQGIAMQYAAAYDEQEKMASYMEAQREAEFNAIYKSASVEERAQMDKFASVHGQVLQILPTDFEKYAYMGGADAAAGMMDQEAAMPPGEEAGPPPGGGEEPLGDQDVVAIIEQLVQSGQITEEEAMAIVEQLQAGGGEGGMPPEGAEGEPSPEEMAAMEGGLPPEAKAASALFRKLTK